MSLSRRQLLGRSAAAGAGLIASTAGAGALAGPAAASSRRRAGDSDGADELFPPLHAGTGDLLALPTGFSYEVIAVSGQTEVHDGTGTVVGTTPERPDGTLAVAARGGYRLVQNHEASAVLGAAVPVPQVGGTVYDPGALGGCTIIETTRAGSRVSEWVGLSGTENNCAGGATPWGAWLSCEESEAKAGTVGRAGGTLGKDHGYVFEVFPGLPADQDPEPIKAWGRAPHEAVVIESGGRRVYLTEDAGNPTGLLYRWTAPAGYRLRPYIAKALAPDAGTLEALAVLAGDGSVLPDLAYVTAAQIGRPFRTSWVSVPERDAQAAPLRTQFAAGQVTHSRKLEGAWGDDDGLYFVASFAFKAPAELPANATPHDGQLWYYDYDDRTLTLRAYFPYNPVLHAETAGWEAGLGPSLDLAFDGPDNVHVTPYESLVLAEDGATANHLLSWTAETGAQAIARNAIVQTVNARGGNVYSEMTGPCFTPDGKVLFANVQTPGHVFAITGPWRRYLG